MPFYANGGKLAALALNETSCLFQLFLVLDAKYALGAHAVIFRYGFSALPEPQQTPIRPLPVAKKLFY